MSADDAAEEELRKLMATLQGLQDDGFDADALAPLEAKIAALEQQISAATALPPLSDAQRAIWKLCDVIDKEQQFSGDDADAQQRITNLRGERKFLLTSLLRSNSEAYTVLLGLLQQRENALASEDFPVVGGAVMDCEEAIQEVYVRALLSAGAAKKMEEEAAPAAAPTAPPPVDSDAEAEAAAAAAEARIEASLNDGVDPTFVRTFLWSEEARFGVKHLVIGERGWSRPQDKIRMKTWMAFARQVLEEGADWPTAKASLAMADPVVDALNKEAGGRASYADDEDRDGTSIEERLKGAYADKAYFLLRWQDRVKREGYTPDVKVDGLSRVGQLRARGKQSDPMSQTLEGESEFEGPTQLNKFFNNLMNGDK